MSGSVVRFCDFVNFNHDQLRLIVSAITLQIEITLEIKLPGD